MSGLRVPGRSLCERVSEQRDATIKLTQRDPKTDPSVVRNPDELRV